MLRADGSIVATNERTLLRIVPSAEHPKLHNAEEDTLVRPIRRGKRRIRLAVKTGQPFVTLIGGAYDDWEVPVGMHPARLMIDNTIDRALKQARRSPSEGKAATVVYDQKALAPFTGPAMKDVTLGIRFDGSRGAATVVLYQDGVPMPGVMGLIMPTTLASDTPSVAEHMKDIPTSGDGWAEEWAGIPRADWLRASSQLAGKEED